MGSAAAAAVVLYLVLQLMQETEASVGDCIPRKTISCQNYILFLHKRNNSDLYVCGTNAYHPTCDHMVIHGTNISLQGRAEESRGKRPFEPTPNYASVFVDGEFYLATSNNFLGTEPIILRSMRNPVKTEFKTSWLNEPSFVNMEIVHESASNPNGDDDKIYVFFTETAVEFEFYDKLLVSRIARICRGDLGGKRILQRRWTSFLKSRLSCSIPELSFHFNVVQDIFLLRRRKWQDSIFYGIFSQQWGRLDISAVCAYSMKTIQEVFSKGNYKGPEQGMLYVGSLSQVVQLPVAECPQYTSCWDCVLARDPYCAWSQSAAECILLANRAAHT
ncbi:PREDICTED: semaphorin-4D-like, partial [Mesitornis unicolor]|uniref:semaphorin-4D-like n=1 Tax=Mesitornis unicolor TaxID=54374 RepID=UPI00052929EA